MANGARPNKKALGVLRSKGYKVRITGRSTNPRHTVVGRTAPKPPKHTWYNPGR